MNSLQRPRLLHDWTNEGKSESAEKSPLVIESNPSRRKLDSFKSSPIGIVIDSFSPESLFLTQIGKTGVSNLLMLWYVKEASPREITAEGRIIYGRSLHTATPSTQPAADGAALRKKRSRYQ